MTAGAGSSLVAAQLVSRVVDRPWGLGVVAVHGGEATTQIAPGADPFTTASLFEVGSLTKTVTGFLLADAVLAGECSLATTAGEVVGDEAGPCAGTTLLELATHTSGLPRLPADMAPSDPTNPYADIGRAELLAGLAKVPPLEPGPVAYSNLGFTLLGLLLAEVTGTPYEELLQERLCGPLGLTSTTTEPPMTDRLPGYRGVVQTSWWTGLPGAGRVASTLEDMGRYLRFVVDGTGGSDRQREALELATQVHAEGPPSIGLGWHHLGGGLWHNGGTGGFHTMLVVHRPSGSGAFLVGNANGLDQLDKTAFAVITEVARGQLPP